MLTRTVISPSTIEKIRIDPSTAMLMVDNLVAHGLLLTSLNEITVLTELFPLKERTIVAEYLKLHDLAWTLGMPSSDVYRPEVVISESEIENENGAIACSVGGYLRTAPVAKRQRMKEGKEAFNREEFWTWLVEPIVASLPLRDRRVDIVDHYLFNRMQTIDDKGRGTFDSTNHGIVWFLRELRNTTIAGPAMVVTVYTPELDPWETGIDLLGINQLCQRHLAPLVNDKFQINVRVIRYWKDRKNAQDLRDAYHGRRVFFNETREIVLDKGMEDLTMMDRGHGYPEDRISESVTFKRHAVYDYTNKYVGVMRDKYKTALWTDHPEYIITL